MQIFVYKSAFIAATAIAALTLAAPAQADDDATMPDVTGEVLQSAESDISDVSTAPASMSNVNGPTQNFYNATNWFVCSQTPSAGDEVTSDVEISLDVRRPGTSCPE